MPEAKLNYLSCPIDHRHRVRANEMERHIFQNCVLSNLAPQMYSPLDNENEVRFSFPIYTVLFSHPRPIVLA